MTLSSEGGISMEMEKVLRKMPNGEGVESTKVLELNPAQEVFAALKAAHEAGAVRSGIADCRSAHRRSGGLCTACLQPDEIMRIS